MEELPKCDLIHFSSPCIDFSQAGKKLGMSGKGGRALLYEVYRLFSNYDKNLLPKFFSFEKLPFCVSSCYNCLQNVVLFILFIS